MHNVLYPLTNFELKIQFVQGEIKKEILLGSRLDQLKLFLNFAPGFKRIKWIGEGSKIYFFIN
jgi:hypothetical protein